MASNISSSNLIDGCPRNVTDALHSTWTTYLGQCVLTPLEYTAVIIGLSSNLFFSVSKAPQIITNCRYKKADSSLSFWFLMCWLVGNLTNLIGAFLTDQLLTQKITAIYFMCVDSILMFQFLYYVHRNQGYTRCYQCPGYSSVLVILPGLAITGLVMGEVAHLQGAGAAPGGHHIHAGGRALLSTEFFPISWDSKTVIGYTLGCVSGILYVTSRLPQICKNFSRCSVEGLALPMFLMAAMGNTTYALGILLYSIQPDFILLRLPWLVGSAGTIFFDIIIFTQFMIFYCKCNLKRRDYIQFMDDEGHSVEMSVSTNQDTTEEERQLLPMPHCCLDLCQKR